MAGTQQHSWDTASQPGHGNTAVTRQHGRNMAVPGGTRPGHGGTRMDMVVYYSPTWGHPADPGGATTTSGGAAAA